MAAATCSPLQVVKSSASYKIYLMHRRESFSFIFTLKQKTEMHDYINYKQDRPLTSPLQANIYDSGLISETIMQYFATLSIPY
jgi:hypothetical protein